MKDFFLIKDAIDPNILQEINEEIENQFFLFKKRGTKVGGLKSGNLNALIGRKYAKVLHKACIDQGIFEKVENFFDISLEDYFLTVGCNVNLPGSVRQHIHSDSDFDKRIIIINIPTISVNEENGSTEIFPQSNLQPLSYLGFLLNYSGDSVRINTSLGDVFVRDSRVWHRGMENYSNSIRPMIAFTLQEKNENDLPEVFYGAWSPYSTETSNFPKEIEFLHNWFNESLFSSMLESLVIKFPIIRSIKRVIFSLLKPKGSAT